MTVIAVKIGYLELEKSPFVIWLPIAVKYDVDVFPIFKLCTRDAAATVDCRSVQRTRRLTTTVSITRWHRRSSSPCDCGACRLPLSSATSPTPFRTRHRTRISAPDSCDIRLLFDEDHEAFYRTNDDGFVAASDLHRIGWRFRNQWNASQTRSVLYWTGSIPSDTGLRPTTISNNITAWVNDRQCRRHVQTIARPYQHFLLRN